MNYLSELKVIDIGDALLDRLREVYPNKLPNRPTTEVELARLLGQNDVIEYLEELQRTINEQNLASIKPVEQQEKFIK